MNLVTAVVGAAETDNGVLDMVLTGVPGTIGAPVRAALALPTDDGVALSVFASAGAVGPVSILAIVSHVLQMQDLPLVLLIWVAWASTVCHEAESQGVG